MMSRNPVTSLVEALGSGAVEVVDLTQPLNESTPVIRLPEEFAQTPGLKRHEISRYDKRGPAWAWYWLEIGEHVGTHFDAPIHWISGRESLDVSQVPPRHLVAPAVVIDRSAESAENPDYLLTVEEVRAFEASTDRCQKAVGCCCTRGGTHVPKMPKPSSTPTNPATPTRPASTSSAPVGSPRRAL